MEKHGHEMMMGGAAAYIKVHQPDACAVGHNVEGECVSVCKCEHVCERRVILCHAAVTFFPGRSLFVLHNFVE